MALPVALSPPPDVMHNLTTSTLDVERKQEERNLLKLLKNFLQTTTKDTKTSDENKVVLHGTKQESFAIVARKQHTRSFFHRIARIQILQQFLVSSQRIQSPFLFHRRLPESSSCYLSLTTVWISISLTRLHSLSPFRFIITAFAINYQC